MRLAQLCDKHIEETAYIFATGASLDRFNMSTINGPRICLNRTIGIVPIKENETYWLVCDDAWGKGVPGLWDKWFHDMVFGNGAIGVFQDPLFGAKRTKVKVPIAENIAPFHIRWDEDPDDLLDWSREVIALNALLYSFSGTAAIAAHLAWLMGCTDVVLVGCDGDGTTAKCLSQWYDDKPVTANHKMSRQKLYHVIERLGLNWSTGDTTDGKI